MAELPTDQELNALDGLCESVAARLAQGRPPDEVVTRVVDAGWDRPSAAALVETVERALGACLAAARNAG